MKQRSRATLGFPTFQIVRATLSGVDLVHMIHKGHARPIAGGTDAEQFYALAS